MKVNYKFGKNFEDISDIKKFFIEEDKALFKKQKKLFKIYSKQPKRIFCKNCNKKLFGDSFNKIDIPYIYCKSCGHLNGKFQDTPKLAKYFYEDEDKDYSKFYISKKKTIIDYKNRTNKIYTPKLNFVVKNLPLAKNNYSFLDVGCGAGHYVSAMKNIGISSFVGYDPSKTMINFGNKINNFKNLNFIKMKDLANLLEKIKLKKPIILSMIGTFEHIYNNREIIKSIKKNKNIKYFYISVPCYSFSTFVETVFDNNFQRLMAPQHNHVYTDKSLKYFANEFKLKSIAEWWFGTDIFDLYRSFLMKIMKDKKNNGKSLEMFNQMYKPLLNDLQLIIDKNKKSSEVHILFKSN